MAVGEVQQAYIAEALDTVVEPRTRGQVERRRRIDRQTGRGGSGNRVQEFATVHAFRRRSCERGNPVSFAAKSLDPGSRATRSPGMTRLFPIAATLRVLLSDVRVTC